MPDNYCSPYALNKNIKNNGNNLQGKESNSQNKEDENTPQGGNAPGGENKNTAVPEGDTKNVPGETKNITENGTELSLNSPYDPILNFDHLKSARNLNFNAPTTIQKYAIPILLNNHSLMVRAPTGMGKTLCFLLPLIENISRDLNRSSYDVSNRSYSSKSYPSSTSKSYPSSTKPYTQDIKICVISPTRELCEQIKKEADILCNPVRLHACAIYGGVPYTKSSSKIDVLVATPGRLLDVLRSKSISLSSLRYLVLDEADMLLDLGFEEALTQIKNFIPSEVTVGLFSATYHRDLARVIKKFLPANSFKIEIKKETLESIKQEIIKCDREERKKKLNELLKVTEGWRDTWGKKKVNDKNVKNDGLKGTSDSLKGTSDTTKNVNSDTTNDENGKIIIFTETRNDTEVVARELKEMGHNAAVLHGEKEQEFREREMLGFRKSLKKIMVATSLVARGIDVKDVCVVINYNLPRDIKEYIHRIGRTGRSGSKGRAVSFICEQDVGEEMRKGLIEVLKESNNEIPEFLKAPIRSRDGMKYKEMKRTGGRRQEYGGRKQQSSLGGRFEKISISEKRKEEEEQRKKEEESLMEVANSDEDTIEEF